MATRLNEELGLRLRNWGRWVRGGMPSLEARNGIWADSRGNSVFVADAEIVEFALTTWRQIAKDASPEKQKTVEKLAFLLKLQYAEKSAINVKREHFERKFGIAIIERTYFRLLARAEDELRVLLPDPEGEITVALRALKVG